LVENDTNIHPGFLLKFVDKQYVDDFINKGQLHFSQLGYFIDQENENGDDVIGDRSEGMRIANPDPEASTITITWKDKKYELHGAKDGVLKIKYEYTDDTVRQWGVVSICNIDLFKDGEVVSVDRINKIWEVKLKQALLDDLYRLSGEGTRVPVIFNAQTLLECMDEKLKTVSHPMFMRNVKYYSDESEANISLDEYNEHPENIAFLKRQQYKYQREVRVLYTGAVPYKRGKNIEIGSIIAGAIKLDSFDDLKKIRFQAIQKK